MGEFQKTRGDAGLDAGSRCPSAIRLHGNFTLCLPTQDVWDFPVLPMAAVTDSGSPKRGAGFPELGLHALG